MLRAVRKEIYRRLFPIKYKEAHELAYWTKRQRDQKAPSNAFYEAFYTEYFDLSPESYRGKRVLDLGCGPLGSLEWADMTAERVGLDPLAEQYKKLGTDRHRMQYVASGAEKMPFPDGHFDVVCSFNSLDHVANLQRTIAQIKRVTRTGGLFLLLTDVNHKPTPCEPIVFSWDIVRAFEPEFRLLTEQRFEKKDWGMYPSLRQNIAYDASDPTERYGILLAKFERQ